MSILNTDFFLKVGQPGTATTLSAPGYTIGSGTINVASTGSFPTDTAVIFAIDTISTTTGSQVENPGTYCVFVGTVTSATSIGSLLLLYGTPQNYAAAATTRVFITVSSQHTNRLITGILQQHNQDGTHGIVTATSVTTPTLTVSTTATLPANTGTTSFLADSAVTPAKLFAGTGTTWPWQSWTPTVTLNGGTTNGNAVITGTKCQIGKTVFFTFKYVIGTTTVFTGLTSIYTSLPVAASSTFADSASADWARGSAVIGGVYYPLTSVGISSTQINIAAQNAAGTYIVATSLTPTIPGSWNTGSVIWLSGAYEAA